MKFKIGHFTVTRLTKSGFWIVEAKESFDIGTLFLRVQEFYESSNPKFRGHTFTLMEYMRWYSLNMSEDGTFTYTSDWKGFNVPSDVIHEFLHAPLKELRNEYDWMFSDITSKIEALQHGPYYLIGTIKGDTSTLAHETSHAMWRLLPGYKEKSLELLTMIPKQDVQKMRRSLKKTGYAAAVLDDEIVAYLSTGLRGGLEGFAHHQPAFKRSFNSHKKLFM